MLVNYSTQVLTKAKKKMYLPKQAVSVQRNTSLAVAQRDWSRNGLVPAVMLHGLRLNTTAFGNKAEQTVGSVRFKNCGPVQLRECELLEGRLLKCDAYVPCHSKQ